MNERPEMPEVVSRYFERVTDERATHRGTERIRAWQLGAASRYEYRTEILAGEELLPDRYVVTGRLTGSFPGGTADLRWDFAVEGDQAARPRSYE